MNKVTKILGIIACLAIIITMTACKGPVGPAGPDVFTVTFDTGGGSAVASERVITGGKAREPATPVKAVAAGLYEGTNPGGFIEWQKEGEKFDFDAPITADTDLTAVWNETIDTVAANDVAAAVAYVNANPGEYTLAIDADVPCAPQTINADNISLTIIGLGEERNINLSENGPLFTMGAAGITGISLTIGNNVTLVGRSSGGNGNEDNDNSVVQVKYGAAFTMLDGSKITGNTSSSILYLAAVCVEDSVFTMKGGTITGNAGADADTGGGGVNIKTSRFIMEGGSVTGNEGICGDVCVNAGAVSCTLSGGATIGTLILYRFAPVAIATSPGPSGWIGSVAKLDLKGSPTGTNAAQAANYWTTTTPVPQILQGALGTALSNQEVNRITLGEFVGNNGQRRAIYDPSNGSITSYQIGLDGKLYSID